MVIACVSYLGLDSNKGNNTYAKLRTDYWTTAIEVAIFTAIKLSKIGKISNNAEER
jgi:hypothetical protein